MPTCFLTGPGQPRTCSHPIYARTFTGVSARQSGNFFFLLRTLLPHSFLAPPLPEHWGIETDLPEATTLSYSSWLSKWTTQLQHSPAAPQVLLRACSIQTPLCSAAWQTALLYHPNQPLTQFFLEEITRGFHNGYNYFSNNKLKSARKNLQGALQHPAVVDKYIDKELVFCRMVGPFEKYELPNIQISRFDVIPKHHQLDQWQLIIDLSYPKKTNIK